jgi:FemAB-related protein (PEP-CTERM system-associated)
MLAVDQQLTAASICNYAECFQAAWDDYVRGHSGATFFHLTAWKHVVEKVFGCKARYLFIEQDGAIRGVLPLFEVSSPVQGRALISVPYGVYGGPCADSEQLASELRAAACRMAKQDGVDYLELREREPSSDPGFHAKKLYYSFDSELPKSSEELLKEFPRDTRYMIRKAQKNGLRAVVDSQYLDLFYDIFSESYHHLGTPVFPKRLFKAILEEFGGECELTTIWHNTKAVAAVMSFRFRDWIVPYFGGSYLESRRLAANNFMYWEVMKRGLETGARFFDFGRSKMGTGAYAFKTQWNMRVRELPYQYFLVRRKTMPNFSPVNPKFNLSISLWKAMPLSLTRVLGPTVIRWFP